MTTVPDADRISMQEVFPPYRVVLGPGEAMEPRVPQNCTRTSPPCHSAFFRTQLFLTASSLISKRAANATNRTAILNTELPTRGRSKANSYRDRDRSRLRGESEASR